MSRGSVGEYLRRFAESGLGWPLPEEVGDAELEQRLFPPVPTVPSDSRVVPAWAQVHQDLRRPGVTLMLLWEEYRAAHPEGFGYSWFCQHYEHWSGALDVVMRLTHRAVEKLFIDYAGQTVEVIDRTSVEVRQAQVFVAVLGASNYTYIEATWTQGLADWIGAHVRAVAYFGAVPAMARARQSEGRGEQGPSLRAGPQSHLLGVGDALRGGRGPGTGTQTPGQGQGGSECPDRATLGAGGVVPVAHWHEIIGDPTLADAILDRLVHNAYHLTLTGESMRKRHARSLNMNPAGETAPERA